MSGALGVRALFALQQRQISSGTSPIAPTVTMSRPRFD
jgi:hypothetical protein